MPQSPIPSERRLQIAQIAQMESPTMTSASERLARIRSDFARLHAAWFGDLMTLRRDGVLEHTWAPQHACADDSGIEDGNGSTNDWGDHRRRHAA
jgi:hypothetical protein